MIKLCKIRKNFSEISTFQSKYDLQEHLKGNTCAKNLSCGVCGEVFSSKEGLRKHAEMMHLKNPLGRRKKKLLKTRRRVQNLSRPERDKVFTAKNSLNLHRWNLHSSSLAPPKLQHNLSQN